MVSDLLGAFDCDERGGLDGADGSKGIVEALAFNDEEGDFDGALGSVAFKIGDAVALFAESGGDLLAADWRDDANDAAADGDSLFDGDADEVSGGEPACEGDDGKWVLQVADQTADGERPDGDLKEAEYGGGPLVAVDDEDHAHGANRHVADSSDEYEKRDVPVHCRLRGLRRGVWLSVADGQIVVDREKIKNASDHEIYQVFDAARVEVEAGIGGAEDRPGEGCGSHGFDVDEAQGSLAVADDELAAFLEADHGGAGKEV